MRVRAFPAKSAELVRKSTMNPRRIRYPFVPKSLASLIPGQFWALPLSSGMYGCGRVIQLEPTRTTGARGLFLGAVLDWASTSPPTPAAISGVPCVAQGCCHIRTITETGGEVLGHRCLDLDGILPWLFRGAHHWKNSFVQRGLVPVRPQTPADSELPVLSIWGSEFASGVAESRFVTNTAP